ncbi:protein FAM171A1-like isoform X2 [Crotalus tigris]|uniref:protein FAM171A1-like isoform X2 n=1 Tax=Crotalus tigris TaxID=88082 RepID=UPI00192F64E7|nr:protein FAM171A1-like isoform X2 [Crotalus tigris]XP_039187686.1 protein FAM171A1-like isoform X2 [Crotalus tigris]
MSPTNPGHIVTNNNNTDQKLSVLAILGGIALILLVLLCFLLYYFRRKLLKPRQLFKKVRLSSISGSKKDQSTSTSNLNLVFSQHELEFPGGLSITSNSHPESFDHKEVVMVDVHANQGCSVEEADMHTPVFLHTYSTSQEFSPREGWLSHEENDRSHMSLVSMASFFINPSKPLEKIKGSPDKGHSRHSYSTMLSQSLFEKPEQSRFSVELSSTHSQQEMQLQQRQPQHLAAQAVSQQHLQEAGTGDWKPQYIVVTESFQTQLQCTASLSDELLNKKAQIELGGGKSLPHPQAWFVSLDGKSNRVRHSYIDLQTSGRNGINDVSQDSTDDINEPKSARKGRAGHLQQTRQQVQMYPQKDLDEVDQSGSECETMACTPEDNSPRCVLEGGRRRRDGQLPSLQEETLKRNVESPSNTLPNPEHKITAHSKADCDDSDTDEHNHQREDKKTPWQKREERPVILFNPK